MNRFKLLFYLTVAMTVFAAPATAKKIRIVTTTTDIQSITALIGGEYVTVNSISNGKQDPHFIEARPSYMIQLRRADLFIRIGLELERGWEKLVLEGSRNGKIQIGSSGHLDLSQNIDLLDVPTGAIDRSMGDVHPFGNPHYWLDPYNGRQMAATIAEKLAEMDRDHAAEYRANAEFFAHRIDVAMFGAKAVEEQDPESLWQSQLAGELASTGEGWHTILLGHRGTQLVTYHRSWTYFLHRFGLVSIGELESKPGISPSPGHLRTLIATMKAAQVPIIIVASFKSNKASNLVAQKTGAIVVKVPYSTHGNEIASDYIEMIDQVVRETASALNRES